MHSAAIKMDSYIKLVPKYFNSSTLAKELLSNFTLQHSDLDLAPTTAENSYFEFSYAVGM